MRIAHLADTHLGYQAFSRVDRQGRNVMEEMVYQGFRMAVDKILELNPDLVIHAGDVFHHVRPRIRPLYEFKQALDRLTDAGIPVVMISGNHDAPKGYASISPFYIYEGQPEVYIAHEYRYKFFDLDEFRIHCIPFCLTADQYPRELDRLERTGSDLLVMHGLVESLRAKRLRTVGEHEIGDCLLKSDLDYIALGHYHNQVQIAGNAWYSGSLDYLNFGEANDRKGFLLVDLGRMSVERIEVRPGYMVDCQPISCSGLSSAEVMEEIEGLAGEIDGKIIRITLRDISRPVFRGLNQSRLNRIAASAVYMKVRPEFPDQPAPAREGVDMLGLEEEFERFLQGEQVRTGLFEEVRSYGRGLLKEAEEARRTEGINAPL
ncbi:MAG: DNA double-strand break repair protein Mre11 [Methanosaeta sp. PtaB.Bin039]|nr:MAG: DNA double-strand break repair protein Mre11 [Methanosaeta sp. PtaB.Bin039]OPY46086.1 MAG: DNA double-strand break repair protein Mre11 [Methanosaeta sp. PtaU1.Bin028]HOT06037.1 exonuclease SbcCD subunit D [Methanotrichaceae archaeon]HQF16313.1 exonuclease SbcCD subunit D [Methanotrichaceae archaeon]HQI90085.1 exonuclease SbcCD subunit D [Methanotrichaceae archaeon]